MVVLVFVCFMLWFLYVFSNLLVRYSGDGSKMQIGSGICIHWYMHTGTFGWVSLYRLFYFIYISGMCLGGSSVTGIIMLVHICGLVAQY